MSITINIYYTGENSAPRDFVHEMISSGIVDEIKSRKGNERYEYFYPLDDENTVLLIDRWSNQQALDEHHNSPLMGQIAALRDKYDLHMKVERFVTDDNTSENDKSFIRE